MEDIIILAPEFEIRRRAFKRHECTSPQDIHQPQKPLQRVDVWIATVKGICCSAPALRVLTDGDGRSLRLIRSRQLRDASTATAVIRRLALSRLTDGEIAPNDWKFSRNESGKPMVARGQPQLSVSSSHTKELCAVAVSSDLMLGIDIEDADQGIERGVVSDILTEQESCRLIELQEHVHNREFFRFWTAGEACSKLNGEGLAGNLRPFTSLVGNPAKHETLADDLCNSSLPDHIERMCVFSGASLSILALAISGHSDNPISIEILKFRPSRLCQDDRIEVTTSVCIGE